MEKRNETHGDAVENMQAIATEWSNYLQKPVRPEDVAMMMYLLHVVRDEKAPVKDPAHHEHALGYLDILRLIMQSDPTPWKGEE